MPHPSRLLTHRGRTLPLKEWARLTGRPANTIASRIDRLGWSVADALDTPASERFRPRPGCPGRGRPKSPPRYPAKPHATGQAVVRVRGRCVYLGRHGTPDSHARYERLLRGWRVDPGPAPAPADRPGAAVTVGGLADRYLAHCEGEYVKMGRPTSEVGCVKLALRALNRLHAGRPAALFGPQDLEAVRDALAAAYVRASANGHLWRLKALFRWGAARGLVPAATYHALLAVKNVKRGRGRDNRRRVPAPVADVRATVGKATAALAAMAELQLLAGLRPGEACALRAEDLDRSGPEWLYTVADASNKNLHRDRPQTYWLGPQAQALLAPFLAAAGPGEYLFRPPRSAKGRYTVENYRQRLAAAARRAGAGRWTPHQLRHAKGQEARDRYGKEAAAEALGDSFAMADRYSVASEALRRRVARETG